MRFVLVVAEAADQTTVQASLVVIPASTRSLLAGAVLARA
jgi:hypothetical protein